MKYVFVVLLSLFFYLSFTSSVQAAAVSWDGGAGTFNWEDDNNWSNDTDPTAADDVTINGSLTVDINAATTINSLTLGASDGGTATLNFDYDASSSPLVIDDGNLTVNNDGAITHSDGTASVVGKVYINVQTGSATITGTINVDGKGYSAGGANTAGNGTGGGGAGVGGCNPGGGGSYGGAGSSGSGCGPGAGGTRNGSLTAPTDLGSGGGGSVNTAGGDGGGAVRLNVAGTLTISGSISANGNNGVANGSTNGSGGGSGGGIYLTAGTLAGAGTVQANGGAGGICCSVSTGGGGGGGRIAMYYSSSNSFSGTISVALGSNGPAASYNQGYGTAFIEDTVNFDIIIPSQNGMWSGTDRGSWDFRDFTINGGIYLVPVSANLLTISSSRTTTIASSTFTIYIGSSNTTNSNGKGVFLNLTGNVTIPSTVTLSADGMGYAAGGANTAGSGTGGGGAGVGGCNPGGGGGYGASGGAGSGCSPGAGGSSYGSASAPTDLGSGGGGSVNVAGGAGGGAIKITTTGTLSVAGIITANGVAGYADGSNNGSGGGSGGSVYLTAGIITGSGTIRANGGGGGQCCSVSTGGNGAGGRVAIYYATSNNWSGNSLTAAGAAAAGSTGNGGSNGTMILGKYSSSTNKLFLKLDDGTGTSAQDSSVDSDGTLNGGALWKSESECVAGKCVFLDGSNDNVSVSDNSFINFAADDDFTIEIWAKHSGPVSAINYLITKADTSTGGYKLYMDSSGNYCFGVDDDGTWSPDDTACSSGTSFADDKWHHIIGLKSGTTKIEVYVDGILRGSDNTIAATGTLSNNNNLYIGIDRDGSSNPFKGFIDEVKVFNEARSSSKILSDYNARAVSHGLALRSNNLGLNNPNALSNGLIGYWKMDETAANSCTGGSNDNCDSSGNGRDMGWNDSPTITTGKFGNGVSFDGSNDYGGATDNDDFDFTGSEDFTLAMWIKRDSASHLEVFMVKESSGTGWEWNTNAGSDLRFYYNGVYILTGTGALADTNWHHIVVSVNRIGNALMFVDGSQVATAAAPTASAATATNLYVAVNNGSTGFFDGTMDEVRIYNRALSPAEVFQLFSFAPGPIGYWKLDEKTGTTANDSSGNEKTATITPGNGSYQTGKFGGAYNFDSADSRVVTNSTYTTPTQYTVSFWYYARSNGETGDGHMFAFKPLTRFGFQSGTPSRNLRLRQDFSGTDGVWTSPANALVLNTWQHVAITYDNSSTSNDPVIYLNGVKQAITENTTPVGSAVTSASSWVIGNTTDLDKTFDGLLDDIKIYDYIRTPTQIIQDMNAGHDFVGSPVSSTIAYWKLDEGVNGTCPGGLDVCNFGSGGSALDGSNVGNSWTQSGKVGKGMSFTNSGGNTNYINVADNDALSFGDSTTDQPFSVSLWFKFNSLSSNTMIIAKRDNGVANGAEWWIGSSSGGQLNFSLGDDADGSVRIGRLTASGAVTTGNWYHFVGTYDGSATSAGIKIYLNGKQVDSSDDQAGSYTAMNNSTAAVTIGAYDVQDGSVDEKMDGIVDEIRIYGAALTLDEIRKDMNQASSQAFGALGNNSSYEPNAANQEYCVPGDTSSCASPVVRWNFEEGTGTTAKDTSGNANNGSWVGTTTNIWKPGKIGKAGNFNGSDNILWNTSPSNLPSGTGARTVEAWFKLSSTAASGAIFGHGRNTSDGDRFMLYFDASTCGGSIGIEARNAGQTFNWTPDTNWHHLVGVFPSGQTNLNTALVYLDGKQMTTSCTSTSITINTINTELIAGGIPVIHSSLFNGRIDEAKIFNYARSAAQIAWDYNKGAPVAHWKFDDCQGSSVIDSTGNSQTGAITIGGGGSESTLGDCQTSSTAWGDGVTGKMNYSLSLDGTDDYVTVTDSNFLDLSADGTWMAWVYLDVNNATQSVLNKDNHATTSGYAFYVTNAGKIGLFIAPTNTVSTTTISTGTWHHIAAVKSGTTVNFYLNGAADGTDTVPSSISTNALNLGIGAKLTGPTEYFNGKLDDVRLYNYAMTSYQIKQAMNLGGIRFGPTTGAP